MAIQNGRCWVVGAGQARIAGLSTFLVHGRQSPLGGTVTNNQTLIAYSLSIADAAGGVHHTTRTGLGGEFVAWELQCRDNVCDENRSVQLADGRYNLQPDVLETWYYAFRATRDRNYLERSWSSFESINRYRRTDTGFSAIIDVNREDGRGKADKQEIFGLTEVLKYVSLIHLEDRRIPLDK